MISEEAWRYLSLVACISALIAIFRFKKIPVQFRPFIYFLWLASLNEIVSEFTMRLWQNNAVNSNFYILFEFIFITWLFKNWFQQTYSKRFFKFLMIGGSALWLIDNCILHSLFTFNSFFRIIYSFIIVFLSIEELNLVLFERGKNILKNAKFQICLIFIIYFTYKATVEVFYLVDSKMSDAFSANLYDIMTFVNLFANIFYAVAVLCIPKKLRFSLPY